VVDSAVATLTITAKGQVTLRQELLRHLGVQPGQQIEVTALPGGRITTVATLEELQAAAMAGWAGEP